MCRVQRFLSHQIRSIVDALLPGPKVPIMVLSRWRVHQFSTDIVKMFRQIRIHPDDSDLQRILWRADPLKDIQDFRLLTVTYGYGYYVRSVPSSSHSTSACRR